jgi:hypothetical protein
MKEFLRDIKAFLKESKVSKSAFGANAAGDRNLVFDLESGRELRSRTRQRVKRYIDQQRQKLSNGCH